MTLESRKIQLVKAILSIEDEKWLTAHEELERQARIEAYEAKLKPMAVEELRQRTLKSHEEFKAGKVTDIEDVIRESENW